MHRLIDKNLETRQGVCEICGPTRIIKVNQGGRCPVAHQESNTRHYETNSGEVIKLSGKDRLKLLEQFGKFCMICDAAVDEKPQLDHCHETGQWRGVLCRDCNIGLGMFKDDEEFLLNAVVYLRSSARVR